MEKFIALQAAVLLLFAVYVTGYYDESQEHVLVDNKCKCVKISSKFVLSKEDPSMEILERNIQIMIPLSARRNISDPTSPIRRDFVYNLSKLCQKCDPVETEVGGVPFLVSQGSCSKPDEEDSCYTYDRNKCYTSEVPFMVNGKKIMKQVPLNHESCYE
ncbi:immunoglobulin J chain [Dendropsophus ebraccatus]|uniref:immunoglobulin J chain n=1 Tax=Dendropsophus ebraccatus TaxID=150705 RepID=UPI0038317A90